MEDDSKRSPAPAPEQPKAATPREALAGQAAPAKRSFSVSSAPAMELPKGGGAIRGLGETFKVNSATGTASFGVPLPISPAPRGPTPDLGLSYDSGGGNSPFGLGWSVSLPAITRKTDKKLPEYLDSEDSDLFLLSGAEDLVPTLDALGARVTSTSTVGSVTTKVDRYRPRVEGLFSIIERVTTIDTGASPPKSVHWRAITKDNIKSTFGSTAATRIADPQFAHKVFTWLLERTEDDRGNVVLYEYKAEDNANWPVGKPSEVHHKDGLAPATTQKYLKAVHYGNKVISPTALTDFCFKLVFDYGEHADNTDTPTVPWPCRLDPFSSFRSGFEIRTYRLCRRVLMFHRFSELTPAPTPTLIRALELTYDTNELTAKRFAKLLKVQSRGYVWNATTTQYDSTTLPPVTFAYSSDALNKSIKFLDQDTLGSDFPAHSLGANAEWVDLDQEGLPGVLIDHGSSHRFKRNNGGSLQGAALLSSVPNIVTKPVQLLDIAGAGTLAMVLRSGNESGFSERRAEGWGPFTPFQQFPTVDLKYPSGEGR